MIAANSFFLLFKWMLTLLRDFSQRENKQRKRDFDEENRRAIAAGRQDRRITSWMLSDAYIIQNTHIGTRRTSTVRAWYMAAAKN